MTLLYLVPPSGIQHLHMPRMPQMAMDARMRGVDMRATGSGQGLIPVTSPTSPAVPHSMSVPGTMMDLEIQQVSSGIQNTRSPVLWWFCVSLFMLTSRDWHLMWRIGVSCCGIVVTKRQNQWEDSKWVIWFFSLAPPMTEGLMKMVFFISDWHSFHAR